MKNHTQLNQQFGRALVCGLVLAASGASYAAEIVKADNADNLDQGTSWTNGVPPTSADIAVWNGIILTPNTPVLGVDTNYLGLKVLNPAVPIAIAAGSTLTLGASGIDMSAATQDLTLGCGVNLGVGQTWNIAGGRVLNVNAAIAGVPTGGLTVGGNGILGLGAANTYSNGTTINGGAVIALNGTTFLPGANFRSNTITFQGGAISNNWGAGNQVNINYDLIVPAGQTGTIHMGNRIRLAPNGTPSTITGGGTLNFVANSTVTRDDIGSQCGAFTGTVNFIGSGGIRFFINAGAFTGFSNAVVNVSGPQFWNFNCNSGGNTFDFGTLQGTNTAAQIGFVSAGNFPRIVVGRLNTDATLAAQIVGNASIFKTGTGAYTLPATQLHTLSNSVQAGRLIFVTGGSASNCSQTVVSHTAGIGIRVSPNALQWVGTNFIFGTGTTLLEFNLGGSTPSTTVAPLVVRGNLTLNSSNIMVGIMGGNWSVGQFPLVNYTGTLGGTFGFAALNVTNLPARVQGYLSNNTASTSIDLVVTNTTQPLTWAGGSGTWDTTSTFIWRDGAGVFRAYQDNSGFGDSVRFEDTLSGSSPITVTLNSTVVPVSVTHNGAKNFTISGSGGIGGFGSVTKQGSGTLTLATANSFVGGINLNGGILNFSALSNLGGSGSPIVIGGGTLQYAGGNTADISAGRSVTFGAGGATIDTGANNITNSAAVGNNGAGGLTKTGVGALTLSGTNSYSGVTTVAQGTLALSSGATISSSSAIVVSSGAVLDATASDLTLSSAQSQILAGAGAVLGNVTAPDSTTIMPGTNSVVGTLTFSNDVALSGGTFLMDISTNAAARDQINISGTLVLNSGNLQLSPSTALTNGTYRLIRATSGVVGSTGSILLTGFAQAGQIAFLSDATAGEVDLVVAAAGTNNLVWVGNGAGNAWDVAISTDWSNSVTAATSVFTQGDTVTFNSVGAANPVVSLPGPIYPNGVTVNASTDYTFQDSSGNGSGKIIGPTSITKGGSGTLTMLTVNNNTGVNVINGGTLKLGNGSTTGGLGFGNVTNNGSLVFAQNDDRSVKGIISGSGSLIQQGSGALTLLQNNIYTGPTTISSGTLQVGNGGATGTLGSGPVTNIGVLVFNRSGTFTNVNGIAGSGAPNPATFAKGGTGTLTLGGTNTYEGNTIITNGTLKLGASEVIPDGGATTGWLILDAGATAAGLLDLNGFNETVNALAGTAGTVVGRIANNTGTATNTLTVNQSVATTFAGSILDNTGSGGRVALLKKGTGTLTLSGAGSYSGGSTVMEGTLSVGNIGGGTGEIVVTNGVTLNSIGFFGNNIRTLPASTATVSTTVALGNNATGGNFTSADSVSTNSIVGLMSFGTANVKQFQTFTGTVRIESGSQIRFSSTSLTVNGGDNTLFEVIGTLNTRNGSGNGEGVAIGALTGNGIVASGASGGTVRMNIGARGMNTEFSGQVVGTAPNTLDIRKVGTGTLTLSGSLGYDGSTTVSNGVLALAGSAELDDSSEISVKSGAFLDVSGISGNLNLGSITPQALTGSGIIRGSVTAGSSFNVISPGDGAGLLTNTNGPAFFDSSTIGTLTITNGITASATSQFLMQVNRTNTPINCDRIIAPSVAANGATSIIVQNIGPPLQAGDKFNLFSVPVSGGYTFTRPALIGYQIQDNLAVDGSITVTSGLNTNSPVITSIVGGNTLQLSWPVDHTGWTLQVQTNAINVGISTNWFTVAGSTFTNQVSVPINPANPTVFYRLNLPLP